VTCLHEGYVPLFYPPVAPPSLHLRPPWWPLKRPPKASIIATVTALPSNHASKALVPAGTMYGLPDHAPTALPCLAGLVGEIRCALGQQLFRLPRDGWDLANITCALESPSYLTIGIAENVQPNLRDLSSNPYYDQNAGGAGKDFTTQLTCSLFSGVVIAADDPNCGNQQQQPLPVGITQIINGYGFCTTRSPP
ncbi:hypothetical protein DFH07DRAFT_1034163, partial [Mycena maculata]